jgi:cytochrome c peroxidase
MAYLQSLEPLPSPYLKPDGSLSEAAERGKKIFNRRSVGCASCHPEPLFTSLQMKDVDTTGSLDQGAVLFDTPSLRELWRTPPYLHDGRAATVREVLTDHNLDDLHGTTSSLTEREIDDLVAYLLSI